MSASVTIQGLSDLQARIKAAPANIQRIVSGELRDGARTIAGEAKRRAPADQGTLQQQIDSVEIDKMNYEVVSGAEYSAFVEFGTGNFVEIPDGLADYAAQFKGGGGVDSNGLTLKEAIFAWCERKGIDKEAWGAIYASIMANGIHAQPFFFPAADRQKPVIIENIKNALSDVI